ncbi:hypothetical protein ScPMuIL_015881 [Solemya velum]
MSLANVYDDAENVNTEVLEEVMRAKKGDPSKFPSFWEEDEEDIDQPAQWEIDRDPNKRILWAAENNHLEIATSMLKDQPDLVNVRDDDKYSPLHRACYNGHIDMVRMLLSRGADIQARTIDGWQPLHSAARWNQASVVSLLLHNGAEVNVQTQGGQTALHLAASEPDSRETLETLLMNCYIDVNMKNAAGEIPSDICRRTSKHFHLFQIHDPSVNCLK